MNPPMVIAILAGLVAVATALGLLWRGSTGRVRTVAASTVERSDVVDLPEVPLTARATLLQFSTAVCAPCVPTRRLLGEIAAATDGVAHVDLDVTHRADLADRFSLLQTPTTLILDASGAIRARIGGAPRRDEIRAALDAILTAQGAATS
jgi:thiol-disulfide isomerase/thioredoxin